MTELLRYEVPGKGRHYVHPLDEHRMPSVTNVLGVLPKPWLAAWAAKEERALVVRTASKAVCFTLNGDGYVGEAQFGKLLCELQLPHKKAHATIRDSTADDGTQSACGNRVAESTACWAFRAGQSRACYLRLRGAE